MKNVGFKLVDGMGHVLWLAHVVDRLMARNEGSSGEARRSWRSGGGHRGKAAFFFLAGLRRKRWTTEQCRAETGQN